ncbi:glycosyl hydrolase-related protein [Paenibacillus sp. 598K]
MQETNLLERPLAELQTEQGAVELAIKPFEVKTVRVARRTS